MVVIAVVVIALMALGFLFMTFMLNTKSDEGGYKHIVAFAILSILCFVIANCVGVLGLIYKVGVM